jgi:hypothetical protein
LSYSILRRGLFDGAVAISGLYSGLQRSVLCHCVVPWPNDTWKSLEAARDPPHLTDFTDAINSTPLVVFWSYATRKRFVRFTFLTGGAHQHTPVVETRLDRFLLCQMAMCADCSTGTGTVLLLTRWPILRHLAVC